MRSQHSHRYKVLRMFFSFKELELWPSYLDAPSLQAVRITTENKNKNEKIWYFLLDFLSVSLVYE